MPGAATVVSREDTTLTAGRGDGSQVAVNDQGFPVTVAVTRSNGEVEHVRVGTAFKSGDGFTLRLGDLAIGGTPVATASAPAYAPRPSSPGASDGMVFPPYGRSKGMPIVGATMQDLDFYANGSRRSLADPAKARWHDKERVLLAAIEAEIARQQGGGAPSTGPAFDEDGPPHTDDDIPF